MMNSRDSALLTEIFRLMMTARLSSALAFVLTRPCPRARTRTLRQRRLRGLPRPGRHPHPDPARARRGLRAVSASPPPSIPRACIAQARPQRRLALILPRRSTRSRAQRSSRPRALELSISARVGAGRRSCAPPPPAPAAAAAARLGVPPPRPPRPPRSPTPLARSPASIRRRSTMLCRLRNATRGSLMRATGDEATAGARTEGGPSPRGVAARGDGASDRRQSGTSPRTRIGNASKPANHRAGTEDDGSNAPRRPPRGAPRCARRDALSAHDVRPERAHEAGAGRPPRASRGSESSSDEQIGTPLAPGGGAARVLRARGRNPERVATLAAGLPG